MSTGNSTLSNPSFKVNPDGSVEIPAVVKLRHNTDCPKWVQWTEEVQLPSSSVFPSVEKFEERLLYDREIYLDRLRSKKIFLVNDVSKRVVVNNRLAYSRYSESGQRKIKRKIKDRLGGYYCKAGVMMTLTYDPKRFSRLEAWSMVRSDTRRLLNLVNQYRKRHHPDWNLRPLNGLSVVEQQSNGYPHVHFVFPGLRSLMINQPVLQNDLWGRGILDVRQIRSFSPSSYACKYITKMGEKPLMQAYLKNFKLRLYSFSRIFKFARYMPNSGWRFGFTGDYEKFDDLISYYKEEGYTIEGGVGAYNSS